VIVSRRPFLLLGLVLTGTLGAEGAVQRSVSSSKQFYIYCADSTVRVGTSTIAEDTRKALDSLLRRDEHWIYPIVINLIADKDSPSDRPTSRLRLFNTVEGLKIQLDIVMGRMDADFSLRRELLRALLLERSYRHITNVPGQLRVVMPPEWLVRGMHGLIDRARTKSKVEVFRALLAADSLPDLESYMQTNLSSLDIVSLAVYEAYATSLVKSLFELPEGRSGVISYITSLPLTPDDNHAVSLQRHYPSLGDDSTQFAKWWALNLARLAVSDNTDQIGVEQSGRQLAEIIARPVEIEVNGEKQVYALHQLTEMPVGEDRDRQLRKVIWELNEFSTRSNPLFHPVQQEYARLIGVVMYGKKRQIKKVAKALAAVDATLAGLNELAVGITDYMNWVEATQIGELSHDFDNYFREVKRLAAESRRPLREDPVTLYMDSLERAID